MRWNRSKRHGTPWRLLLLHLASAAIFWVAFTGSFSRNELLLGIAAVGVCVAFLWALQRTYPIRAEFRARDLLQILRVPRDIAADAGRVTWYLLRELAGGPRAASRLRLLHWKVGNGDQSDLGRGVLATLCVSASPNSIVLGIDAATASVVVHELVPASVSQTARNLGAQP